MVTLCSGGANKQIVVFNEVTWLNVHPVLFTHSFRDSNYVSILIFTIDICKRLVRKNKDENCGGFGKLASHIQSCCRSNFLKVSHIFYLKHNEAVAVEPLCALFSSAVCLFAYQFNFSSAKDRCLLLLNRFLVSLYYFSYISWFVFVHVSHINCISTCILFPYWAVKVSTTTTVYKITFYSKNPHSNIRILWKQQNTVEPKHPLLYYEAILGPSCHRAF